MKPGEFKKSQAYVGRAVDTLLDNEFQRVTKFISPKEVISVHRISYRNRIDKRDTRIDVRVKIGRPNYHEREFIKDCIKAGEPFPVKKMQYKRFGKPKKPTAKQARLARREAVAKKKKCRAKRR